MTALPRKVHIMVAVRRHMAPLVGWGRWPRTLGYAALATAGTMAIVSPTPAVREAASPTSGWLAYAWAIMIVVGGLSSALGTAFDRWFGEYVGLWPLATTFAVYSLASAVTADRPTGALLLGAFALFLVARWRHVAMVRKEADHLRRQRDARTGGG